MTDRCTTAALRAPRAPSALVATASGSTKPPLLLAHLSPLLASRTTPRLRSRLSRPSSAAATSSNLAKSSASRYTAFPLSSLFFPELPHPSSLYNTNESEENREKPRILSVPVTASLRCCDFRSSVETQEQFGAEILISTCAGSDFAMSTEILISSEEEKKVSKSFSLRQRDGEDFQHI
ncbi:hypothetical protein Syun_029301 [Stephania yunnanensis]|uniref:Uncharacterized protein n=1 Tax=Stephania yunnanensis TaxID=152371 RepID=A0AAP0HJB7_9MAGN